MILKIGKNISLLFTFLLMAAYPGNAQVIKLGTVAPEGSPWHDALLKVAEEWREISNGSVTLRIYPGGVAGDEKDIVRKIRIGQLHATALTSVTLLDMIPDIEALSFPMFIRNDEELDYVISKLGPRFEKEIETRGFKVLGWSMAGWVHFFSKEPVVTVKDMRKRKFFFWGSDATYVSLMKDAGFNPVPLAITDLLPSLETGLVDTFAAPPTAALSFQWFGLAKHMTDLRWQPLPAVTVISTRQWNRIPENLRPQLEAAARKVTKELLGKVRQLEEDAVLAMQEYGLIVHTVSPEVEKEWARLVEEKGHPAFIGPRFSREIFDKVQQALTEYRQKVAAAPPAPAL